MDEGADRERALQAVARLVAQQGLAATTMDQVAAEAGVPLAGLQAAFPNRKALVKALLADTIAGWQAEMERRIDSVPDAEVERVVARYIVNSPLLHLARTLR